MPVHRETYVPEDFLEGPENMLQQINRSDYRSCFAVDAFSKLTGDIVYSTECSDVNAIESSDPFDLQSSIAYPPVIQDLCRYNQPITGYFKEFNLIFVASKNKLFFWDYASQSKWIPVDGIDHPIQFVELVRLRPDVFDPPYEYGILVVTSADILLFSILICDQTFSIAPVHISTAVPPSPIRAIQCTQKGRVFLGCEDGMIREFIYQPCSFIGSFFGWKATCYLQCHSNLLLQQLPTSPICSFAYSPQAHRLFTLQENGSVCMYNLSEEENTLSLMDYCIDLVQTAFARAEEVTNHLPKSSSSSSSSTSSSIQPGVVLHARDKKALTLPSGTPLTPAQLRVADLFLLPATVCPDPILCVLTRNGIRFYLKYTGNQMEMTMARAPPTTVPLTVREACMVGSSLFVLCEDCLVVIYHRNDIRDRYVESVWEYRGNLVGVSGVRVVSTGHYDYELRQGDPSALVMMGWGGIVKDETEPRALVLGVRGVECFVRRRGYDESPLLTMRDTMTIEKISNMWLKRMAMKMNQQVDPVRLQKIDSFLTDLYKDYSQRERFVKSLYGAVARLLRPYLMSCILSDQFTSNVLQRILDALSGMSELLDMLFIVPEGIIPEKRDQNRSLYALKLTVDRCCDIMHAGLTISPIVRQQLSRDINTTLSTVTLSQWLFDPESMRNLTFILNEVLLVSSTSWDEYEIASERIHQNSRGYYPASYKYLYQGVFLLAHTQDVDHKALAHDHLARVFSEIIQPEFPFIYHDLKQALQNLPAEDFMKILLRGISQLVLENWMDCETLDVDQAMHRRQAAIQQIQRDIMEGVKTHVVKGEYLCVKTVLELGEKVLIEEMFDWLIRFHPDVLLQLGKQTDVEEYLFRKSYQLLHNYYRALNDPHTAATFLYEVVNLHRYPQFTLSRDEAIEAYTLILEDLKQVELTGCFKPFAYHSLRPQQIRRLLDRMNLQRELDLEGNEVLTDEQMMAKCAGNPVQRLRFLDQMEEIDQQAMQECWNQILEETTHSTTSFMAMVDDVKCILVSLTQPTTSMLFSNLLVWLITHVQTSPERAIHQEVCRKLGELIEWYFLQKGDLASSLLNVFMRNREEAWRLLVAECIVVVAEKNRACTMPQLLLQNIRGDLTGITDRHAEASVIIGRIDALNERFSI